MWCSYIIKIDILVNCKNDYRLLTSEKLAIRLQMSPQFNK